MYYDLSTWVYYDNVACLGANPQGKKARGVRRQQAPQRCVPTNKKRDLFNFQNIFESRHDALDAFIVPESGRVVGGNLHKSF